MLERGWVPLLTVVALAIALPVVFADDPAPSNEADLNVERANEGTSLRLGDNQPFHTTGQEVVNPRLVEIPGASERLVLWEETTGSGESVPFYAISFDGQRVDHVRQTSYELKLSHGSFDPQIVVPTVNATLKAEPGAKLYIVQFVTRPLDALRAGIKSAGAKIHKYLPNHAYIVRMDPSARQRVEGLPFVRWVGEHHPAYRLGSDTRVELENGALIGAARYNVQVFERGLEQKELVAARIAALGAVVDNPSSGVLLLEATLTPEQLVQVAAWDEVQFVDRWSPYESDIDLVREISGANFIAFEDDPLIDGYTGEGVSGEVLDNRWNVGHDDFDGSLLVHLGPPNPCTSNTGLGAHGAATSGIIFGKGLANATRKGLLPAGQGIVAQFPGSANYDTWDRAAHTAELLQLPYEAVFQSSSVGTSQTLDYTTHSADMDALLFDLDILHFQSQSNVGNQFSRPQAWAKNIVSVGGIRHMNNLTDSDDCWGCEDSAASVGPAEDGRIKPDLAHFYDHVATVGCSQSYLTFGGTSAATPITAGLGGLFFQMWDDGIFGNPTGSSVFDSRPRMATAKAMLINTATQWLFCEEAHDLTRVHQGWGRADVKRLYDLKDDFAHIIDESDFLTDQDSTRSYPVTVDADDTALRATLVYTDPEATPPATVHRINDLTLKVTSPSSVVYWGNHGLMGSNWSDPGGQANHIDTVENVFVLKPETGVWTVEVIAEEITEDGHPETQGVVDVDYALVVSVSSEEVNDCNNNGEPDVCESGLPDCNGNGTPDACDIESGTSNDCNGNTIPDECEADCNDNGLADECDIASGTSEDCDSNGVPDECDPDCNKNDIPDTCDIASGTSEDCDDDGLLDECEADCNENGIADDCEPAAAIYVDAAAIGNNDGTSWRHAYVDLQDALEGIEGCLIEVWVAAGTYKPDRGTLDRKDSFMLLNGVELYGGFSGWETSRAQRDPDFNETILSGRLNSTTESFHVVKAIDVDSTAVLDGFTVKDGNTFGSNSSNGFHGAGLLIEGGSATVRNCTFFDNIARGFGGGIAALLESNPQISNCTFIDNRALSGGLGGGIAVSGSGSSAMIEDCVFISNDAAGGAGVGIGFQAAATVTGSTFIDNDGSFGGAIYGSNESTVILTNNVFVGNESNNGGAIGNSGTMTVGNCSFSGHDAFDGGVVWNTQVGNLTLTNVSMTDNEVPGISKGGALFNQGVATLTNSILWDNSGPNNFGHPIDNQGILTVQHTLVEFAWPGEGNIDVDPLFVDADGPDDLPGTEDDNLRLLFDSPAVDAGNNDFVMESTDLDGNPRIVDGDGRAGAVVDMGAYELPFPDCNANNRHDDQEVAVGVVPDCNANGVPDSCDVDEGWSLDCNWNGIPDECDTLSVNIVGAFSHVSHGGGVGDQQIEIDINGRVQDGNVTTEPRISGVVRLRLPIDALPGPVVLPQPSPFGFISIEQQECPGGLPTDYGPWQGSSFGREIDAVTGDFVLTFSPGLKSTSTYRLGFGVRAIPFSACQTIEVRVLVGDVTGDGFVDAADRAAVLDVIDAGGFSAETDLNLDGIVNSGDVAVVEALIGTPRDCAP